MWMGMENAEGNVPEERDLPSRRHSFPPPDQYNDPLLPIRPLSLAQHNSSPFSRLFDSSRRFA